MDNPEPGEQRTVQGPMEREIILNLLRAAVCPECDGSGAKQVQTGFREYVTREMALDAGDASIEGSLYNDDTFEVEQCQWCYERSQVLAGELP